MFNATKVLHPWIKLGDLNDLCHMGVHEFIVVELKSLIRGANTIVGDFKDLIPICIKGLIWIIPGVTYVLM